MKVYLVVKYWWRGWEHLSVWTSRDAAEREVARLLWVVKCRLRIEELEVGDVMDALAELQAANEAIETAGPLYQTPDPLKDKIVRLIGQRSDLITQVLALRRELDAAHARIRELAARAALAKARGET